MVPAKSVAPVPPLKTYSSSANRAKSVPSIPALKPYLPPVSTAKAVTQITPLTSLSSIIPQTSISLITTSGSLSSVNPTKPVSFNAYLKSSSLSVNKPLESAPNACISATSSTPSATPFTVTLSSATAVDASYAFSTIPVISTHVVTTPTLTSGISEIWTEPISSLQVPMRKESPEEVFTEVSTKQENFICCHDCGRNFYSKQKYNEHVPECNRLQEADDQAIACMEMVFGNLYRTSRKQPAVRKSQNKNASGRTKANKEAPSKSKKGNMKTSDIQKVSSGPSSRTPKTSVAPHVASHTSISANLEAIQAISTSIVSHGHNTRHAQGKSLKSQETYECTDCNKMYYTKYGFKLHLRTHTGQKGYDCDVCGKSFSQSGHLKDHRRIHTGEKPFTCPICDRKFAQNQNLKHHLRMHAGVKPYECKNDGCDKSFFTKCELVTHRKTHTGLPKNYECEFCPKAFCQMETLRAHLQHVHNDGQGLTAEQLINLSNMNKLKNLKDVQVVISKTF